MDEGDAPLFNKSAQQSLAGRCLDSGLQPGQMSEGEGLAQTRRSPPSPELSTLGRCGNSPGGGHRSNTEFTRTHD